MLELLYATGIRAGELIGLDVDDVNPSLGYVRCASPDGRERFVPLGKAAAEALERYLKDGRPHLVRPDAAGTRAVRQPARKPAHAAGVLEADEEACRERPAWTA